MVWPLATLPLGVLPKVSEYSVSRKAPRATFRTFARYATCFYYFLPTAQAVYNLWVAVAFMWGWAAAIIIIGLPLYEHRSAVNNGPFLSSARARLLCLDCYACARLLYLPCISPGPTWRL